jgi:apolipoprotein N-acyltransferase
MAINPPNIQPGLIPSTTVEEPPRRIRMYRVTDQELAALGSVKSGVWFGFFGISFGCFVAFWIVVKTVSGLADKDYTMFLVLTVVFGFLSLLCGVMAVLEAFGTRRLATSIRAPKDGDT